MSFTYEWRRNGSPIATGNTYTLQALDVSTNITCAVTATNALGSTTAVSNTLSIGGPITGTGIIAPQRSRVGGTGLVFGSITGTGAIAAQPSDVDGTGWLNILAIGTLAAQAADLDGGGLVNVIGIGPLAAQRSGVAASGVVSTSGNTTVTAPNGMWWIFSGALTNGVYVNGDPWVLDSGSGVSLIEVSTPTTGTGATTKHGGMINPTFNTYAESSPMGSSVTAAMKIGYDGRLAAAGGGVYVYDSTLNAHLGLPRTLVAGDSLVSAVSNPDTEIGGSNPVAFARMACVTVVGTAPFADSFRPNYFGTTKINKRFSDANLSLMPDLSAMSPLDPKGTYLEAMHIDASSIYAGAPIALPLTNTEAMHRDAFRDLNYWICSMQTNGTLMKPQWNMEAYPRDWGLRAGQLSMYVMINPSDRDFFVKRILQAAIDAHAVSLSTSYVGAQPWGGGAGFWSGPAWWIRLAGLLFNDTAMKNVMSVATGQTDYYGNARNKWGIRNRCYLSTTAHAQYYRVPGEDYSAGFPLYGDAPNTDISGGVGPASNNSARDPAAIFDMDDYKFGLELKAADLPLPKDVYPPREYPNIMDVAYENWNVAGVEQNSQIWPQVTPDPVPRRWEGRYGRNVGIDEFASPISSYARMSYAMMGDVLASIAMGDQAFWGGAVVAYAKRHAHDAQMWSGFGRGFDYNDAYLTPARAHRDVYGHGGTGNQWMLTMWEGVVGAVIAPTTTDYGRLVAQSAVVVGAGTITGARGILVAQAADVDGAGNVIGTTTIFTTTLTDDNTGNENNSYRVLCSVTAGASATDQISVTFVGSTTATMNIDNASIAISSGGSQDATATPVELTFNGGGHGVSIAANAIKQSDWVTLGLAFTTSNTLLVTIDMGPTNGNYRYRTGAPQGTAYAIPGSYYNSIPGPPPFLGGFQVGFNKIEVRPPLIINEGALVAQAADVDGIGTALGVITGTGVLTAQAADVDGVGSLAANIGALVAQASDVDGAGTVSGTLSWTTIYNVALTGDNELHEDNSRRGIVNITGGAGTTNQIRVTFQAHSSLTSTIEFASIAKSTTSGSEVASATPVELTFDGGNHGYTAAGGTTKVSDPVTLGGFTSSDTLLVTVDFASTNGNQRNKTGAAHGQMYALAALNANNYNQISGTWTSFQGGTIVGFDKIEVA